MRPAHALASLHLAAFGPLGSTPFDVESAPEQRTARRAAGLRIAGEVLAGVGTGAAR